MFERFHFASCLCLKDNVDKVRHIYDGRPYLSQPPSNSVGNVSAALWQVGAHPVCYACKAPQNTLHPQLKLKWHLDHTKLLKMENTVLQYFFKFLEIHYTMYYMYIISKQIG